jgi:O-acetyl-ADP-ribose deacetylase (regulator of RNase III)
MNINVKVGDVLDHSADVLISTANPWLNLSGGVNGAILARAGEGIQHELRDYLASISRPAVTAGTVVRTSAGCLPFDHILHAVAIDPFYDSSVELVRQTLENALDMAAGLHARTIAMPTLATGYGPLSIADFAEALAHVAIVSRPGVEVLTVVVRSNEKAETLRFLLAGEEQR